MAQPQVLMFGWEFPPFNSGGLGTACHGLTKALSLQHVGITFVLPRNLATKTESFKIVFADNTSINVKVWDSLMKGYSSIEEYEREYVTHKKQQYASTLIAEVIRYGNAAKEIAKKESHDIIHAHDWLSFKAGVSAKETSGKPFIAHIHATEFDRSFHHAHPEIYKIEKEGLEKADRIIAVSSYTKAMIHKHYRIPQAKIAVVHNGIDLKDYKHMPEDVKKLKKALGTIILFVGRLTLQKGPDYFIKAAQHVLTYEENVSFVVSGSGDMEDQIMQMAASYGISHKIFFTGFLRGDDLNKVYQAADIYIMPSVSEPFGIAALESIANNTPIIVSKQSGVSEVLTHALKSDYWDTEEMTNKIIAILRYKKLREQLKREGRKEIEAYSWDASARNCLNIYQDLI